jgi:hypothetical protein
LRLELALAQALAWKGNRDGARELARSLLERAEAYPRIRVRAGFLLGEDSDIPTTGFASTEHAVLRAEDALVRGDRPMAREQAELALKESARFGWSELVVRASLVLAECELADANVTGAEQLLSRVRPTIESSGFGPSRVYGAALAAGIARAVGEVDATTTHDALLSFLGESDRGADWAIALFQRVSRRLGLDVPARFHVVVSGRVLHVAFEPAEKGFELVIDALRGRARIADREIDLSRKKASLELLVAFGLSSGWASPAELAQSAWQLDYHAVRHHSRLAMAVARLRELIGPDFIESGRDGYRFKPPETWLLIQPV